MVTSHAMAAGYGAAGCGLGSIVIGPKPGFMQVVAATTNATFASQSFGITTGTSNCADKGEKGDKDKAGDDDDSGGKKKKKDKKDKKKQESSSVREQTDFVALNLNTLKRDAAKGEGDSLAALASTLGCDVAVYPKFTKSLQGAHAQIFSAKQPADVLKNIKGQVQANPTLADACDVASTDVALAK